MRRFVSTRVIVVAGLVVAVGLGGSLAAAAQISGSRPKTPTGNVFYGCLSTTTHQLVKVYQSAGHSCPTGSLAVSWNKQGPKGAPGATGPAGSTGPRGPQGATGPKGNNGTNGTDGTNGSTVLTGATVPAGSCTSGDTYIDLNYTPSLPVGEVYQCVSSAWVDSGYTIEGPVGPQGPPASACQVTDEATQGTFSDLQDAINNVVSNLSNNDTLVVSGVCDGNFTFDPPASTDHVAKIQGLHGKTHLTDYSLALTILGSPSATLSAGGSGRVFYVGPFADLTLENLVITGGNTVASGCAAPGPSPMGKNRTGCAGFRRTRKGVPHAFNGVPSGYSGGAGILNGGLLTLTGSTEVIGNNTSGSSPFAAGVDNEGVQLILAGDSEVDNNTATGPDCYGAGIFSDGLLTLEGQAQIDGNNAYGNYCEGAGIYTAEAQIALLDAAQVSDNYSSGTSTEGGGIYNYGSELYLSGSSQVDDNYVTATGGGIFGCITGNGGDPLVIDNTPDNLSGC